MSKTNFRRRPGARLGSALSLSALALLLVGPASASAATVDFTGTTLTYTGAPGEQNRAVLYPKPSVPGTINVRDFALFTSSSANCPQDPPGNTNTVACALASTANVVINVGDGDDDVENDSGRPSTIDAGAGNDRIGGSSAAETITGGDGNDSLLGSGGKDTVNAGAGDDTVRVRGVGTDVIADIVDCGPGNDTVLVDAKDTDVVNCELITQSLEGPPVPQNSLPPAAGAPPATTRAPGPRAPGAGSDACKKVLRGSTRNDRLTGTAAGEQLFGLRGNDTIGGGAGDDCLFGGPGNDKLSGGSGKDALTGSSGKDKLSGGTGNDVLTGGAGNDSLAGGQGTNRLTAGAGNDRVNSANGKRETVNCGRGRDSVRADRSDRLRGCERVLRPRR